MTSLNLFNSDHLLHLCQKYGLRPSKQYGQNYLIDQAVIETIIAAAKLKPDDIVVEVGPGFGVLTFALAARTQKVFAFEIEKKLLPYWKEVRMKNEELRNVEIVWGNVLRFDPSQPPVDPSRPPLKRGGGDVTPPLFKEGAHGGGQFVNAAHGGGQFDKLSHGGGRYKVVANLPYQITSPVIRLFLEAENPPTEMTLMVQKEVAERICAKAGDMSLLSVAVQYYADAEIIRVVPHTSFWPSPAVDSAVIKLVARDPSQPPVDPSRPPLKRGGGGDAPPLFKEGAHGGGQFVNAAHGGGQFKEGLKGRSGSFEQEFFRLVKTGFAQRRKLLIKNLESVAGKKNREELKRVLVEVGLTPQVRAQELSVEQWVKIVQKIGNRKSEIGNF